MIGTLEPAYAITRFVSPDESTVADKADYHKFNVPVELNPVSEKILFLEGLKKIEPNWDGYNAKTPEEQTVDNAILFIQLLPVDRQKALFTDELNLTPYGTVTLEWKAKGVNFLSIEIGKSKIGYLSETEDGENPFKESIDFDNHQIPEDVLRVFEKVFV